MKAIQNEQKELIDLFISVACLFLSICFFVAVSVTFGVEIIESVFSAISAYFETFNSLMETGK